MVLERTQRFVTCPLLASSAPISFTPLDAVRTSVRRECHNAEQGQCGYEETDGRKLAWNGYQAEAALEQKKSGEGT
jgi:hypothetical protein